MKRTIYYGIVVYLLNVLVVYEPLQAQKSSLFRAYDGHVDVQSNSIVPKIYSIQDWCEAILFGDCDRVERYIRAEVKYAQDKNANLNALTNINDIGIQFFAGSMRVLGKPAGFLEFATGELSVWQALLNHPSINIVPLWRLAKRQLAGIVNCPAWRFAEGMVAGQVEDTSFHHCVCAEYRNHSKQCSDILRLMETYMVARGISTFCDDVLDSCMLS